MGCVTCSKLATNARRAKRLDPQQMGLIRRGFLGQINKRFAELKTAIWKAVVLEDGFGLSQPVMNKQFDFPSSAEKVQSFTKWLKQQEKAGVLQTHVGKARASTTANAWTDTYISGGYQRGVQFAASEIAKAGANVSDTWIENAFSRPIHADTVGMIYSRTFTDLEGITSVMDTQISRVLASAIVEGRGAREVARDIFNRVDGIGIVRARTLARTELSAAHYAASLNGYREAGAEGVEIVAEFLTAGDELVCPECEDLAGQEFTLDEAEGLIPVHPNCRCATKPIIKSVNGVELS